jgi:transcriptional regulator with XRE-family HTH domain
MAKKSPFGQALAVVRKATGLTQKQFAGLLGLSPATIASLETRGTIPATILLDRILEATGASTNAMLQGKARTFDGYPYTAQFFADYGKGLRNAGAIRAMKDALLFDVEQVLAAAEREGILLPTILRLSQQILDFADQTELSRQIRSNLFRDVPPASLGKGSFASVSGAPHVLSSKLVALKGKNLIRIHFADAFGHAKETYTQTLRSKAPRWPYEVEPDELPLKELRDWISKLSQHELEWLELNEPSLFSAWKRALELSLKKGKNNSR